MTRSHIATSDATREGFEIEYEQRTFHVDAATLSLRRGPARFHRISRTQATARASLFTCQGALTSEQGTGRALVPSGKVDVSTRTHVHGAGRPVTCDYTEHPPHELYENDVPHRWAQTLGPAKAARRAQARGNSCEPELPDFVTSEPETRGVRARIASCGPLWRRTVCACGAIASRGARARRLRAGGFPREARASEGGALRSAAFCATL